MNRVTLEGFPACVWSLGRISLMHKIIMLSLIFGQISWIIHSIYIPIIQDCSDTHHSTDYDDFCIDKDHGMQTID